MKLVKTLFHTLAITAILCLGASPAFAEEAPASPKKECSAPCTDKEKPKCEDKKGDKSKKDCSKSEKNDC